jgi:YfiH family protein
MNPRLYTGFSIFDKFPDLICVFSTRLGGNSRGMYSGQNLGLRTGDDVVTVSENRRRFWQALGISEEQIAFTDQVHSAEVITVDKPGIYPRSDALITGQEGLFLTIQTADCLPIFIFDPVNRIVAAIHAGWRGAIAGIVQNTLEMMSGFHGLDPENFFAAIGPGLQKECFEIRPDVSKYFSPQYLLPHTDPGKCFLDLSRYVHDLLTAGGIPGDQVENPEICTMCDHETYYSYRRDREKSGRMMGVIGMRRSQNG